MNQENPLLALRAAHAPSDIGWWPPALGWWLLLLTLLALILAISIYSVRRYRALAYKREALREWQRIEQHYQKLQDRQYLLGALSNLLKRTSISRYGRQTSAKLASHEWLEFLDKTGKTHDFCDGPGKVLVTERYQKQPDYDAKSLLTVTRRWLEMQR